METAREQVAAPIAGDRLDHHLPTSGGNRRGQCVGHRERGSRRVRFASLIVSWRSNTADSVQETSRVSGIAVTEVLAGRKVSQRPGRPRLAGRAEKAGQVDDAADGKHFRGLLDAGQQRDRGDPAGVRSLGDRPRGRQQAGCTSTLSQEAAGKIGIDCRSRCGADTPSASRPWPTRSAARRAWLCPDLWPACGYPVEQRRQHGGGQERGRRGGTENTPGITAARRPPPSRR